MDYEELLAKLYEDLEHATPGSEDYKVIADAIAKIGNVMNETDKIALERSSEIVNDDREERKIKAEERQFWIKLATENGVKIACLLAGIAMFNYNLHAEAQGLRADSLFGKMIDRLISQR